MTIYKTKMFARFARRERLANASLIDAVERADRGLVDANLGGAARTRQQGRFSDPHRLSVRRSCCVLYGFAKSDRKNIADDEADDLRELGGVWLGDRTKIARNVAVGILIEVKP